MRSNWSLLRLRSRCSRRALVYALCVSLTFQGCQCGSEAPPLQVTTAGAWKPKMSLAEYTRERDRKLREINEAWAKIGRGDKPPAGQAATKENLQPPEKPPAIDSYAAFKKFFLEKQQNREPKVERPISWNELVERVKEGWAWLKTLDGNKKPDPAQVLGLLRSRLNSPKDSGQRTALVTAIDAVQEFDLVASDVQVALKKVLDQARPSFDKLESAVAEVEKLKDEQMTAEQARGRFEKLLSESGPLYEVTVEGLKLTGPDFRMKAETLRTLIEKQRSLFERARDSLHAVKAAFAGDRELLDAIDSYLKELTPYVNNVEKGSSVVFDVISTGLIGVAAVVFWPAAVVLGILYLLAKIFGFGGGGDGDGDKEGNKGGTSTADKPAGQGGTAQDNPQGQEGQPQGPQMDQGATPVKITAESGPHKMIIFSINGVTTFRIHINGDPNRSIDLFLSESDARFTDVTKPRGPLKAEGISVAPNLSWPFPVTMDFSTTPKKVVQWLNPTSAEIFDRGPAPPIDPGKTAVAEPSPAAGVHTYSVSEDANGRYYKVFPYGKAEHAATLVLSKAVMDLDRITKPGPNLHPRLVNLDFNGPPDKPTFPVVGTFTGVFDGAPDQAFSVTWDRADHVTTAK